MSSRMQWFLAASVVMTFGPTAVQAQFGGGIAEYAAMQGAGRPAISASGTSIVQRKPTQLRLYMQLQVKGKTLDDALAKLKERREAATAQLETLKADKKSIVFGAPSVGAQQSSRRQQIEAMVMAQMRSRGKKAPKGLKVPQTVTLTCTLTAHWPLEAQSPEQLLLLTQGIQEKIKAADLSGSKEAEKLSPEEEEFEEEATQMMNQYNEEAKSAGQANFVFVAILPKEEREKAMAEAFANAKKQAAELAKAAGVNIGPLVGLSGHCGGQSNFGGGFNSYDPSGRMEALQQMMSQGADENPNEKLDETIGADPGTLKFTCTAGILYQIGK